MKILINDLMQFSDLPDDLKTPSLDDRVVNTGIIIVTFTIPTEYSEFLAIDGTLSQTLSMFGISSPFDGTLSQIVPEFAATGFSSGGAVLSPTDCGDPIGGCAAARSSCDLPDRVRR